MMTRQPELHTDAHEPVLSWVFRRDRQTITCAVDASADGSFELCLIPHWDVSMSVIEPCQSPSKALLRHAEMALQLRDSGWTVTR